MNKSTIEPELFATVGIQAVPIYAGEKRPIGENWPSLATDDVDVIRGWLEAGYGLGSSSRDGDYMQVDLDIKGNGVRNFADLAQENGGVPDTFTVTTPTGGVHYYFTVPEGTPIRNTAGAIAPGVDIRAKGGQTKIYGHNDGVAGEYKVNPDGVHRTLAPAPWWLIQEASKEAPVVAYKPSETLPNDFPEALRVEAVRDAEGTFKRQLTAIEGIRDMRNISLYKRACTAFEAANSLIYSNRVAEAEQANAIAEAFDKIIEAAGSFIGGDFPYEEAAATVASAQVKVTNKILTSVGVTLGITAVIEEADFTLEAEIAEEQRRLTIRDEAKRRAMMEEAAAQWTPPSDVFTLTQAVEASKEGIEWCIKGVARLQSRIGLIAQNKSGKSTLALSLAHSYLSGEPFLGQFEVVTPIDGTVVYLNYDMELPDITEWAQKRGLDTERFMILNLRNTQNPFASKPGQAWLKEQLIAANAKAVIMDSFGDGFVGTEQNNNTEVSNWLLDMYGLLTECGVEQQVMIIHAGHGGDHARGASTLEDKLDTKIKLTRDTSDVRHLEMKGRNVDFPKDELVYHEDSHRYTLANKPAQIAEVQDEIVYTYVNDHPGSNRGSIADEWKGKGQNLAKLNDCLARLVASGRILRTVGARGAHHYHTHELVAA